MVMNEPAAFVGLGYMLGYYAPEKKDHLIFLKDHTMPVWLWQTEEE